MWTLFAVLVALTACWFSKVSTNQGLELCVYSSQQMWSLCFSVEARKRRNENLHMYALSGACQRQCLVYCCFASRRLELYDLTC